jgi:hypothetical protein
MPEVDTRPGIHVKRTFHVHVGPHSATQQTAAPGTMLEATLPEKPPPPIE